MQYDGIDATRVRWDLVRSREVSQTTLGLDSLGSGVLVKQNQEHATALTENAIN